MKSSSNVHIAYSYSAPGGIFGTGDSYFLLDQDKPITREVIDRTELPDDVGLMYYSRDGARKLTIRQKARWRDIEEPVDVYRYIIYSRLEQDRIPFFNDRKEYAEAYLQDKEDAFDKTIIERMTVKNVIINGTSR